MGQRDNGAGLGLYRPWDISAITTGHTLGYFRQPPKAIPAFIQKRPYHEESTQTTVDWISIVNFTLINRVYLEL